MPRQLASIQIVENICNIEKSDNLELAIILGWKVVIRKHEVQVGDKVIYCEIDSMLPVSAEWLPPAVKSRIERENVKDYFRVKTIKLRGQISQGLIIPIFDDINDCEVNTDVTDLLSIIKYSPPEIAYHIGTKSSRNFPTNLISKTDEPRIQSNPHLLKAIEDKSYYITIKFDGTSSTYVIDPDTDDFLVCSRNYIKDRNDTCLYWNIADKYKIEEILRSNPDIAIQGEICGPNVQKNPMNYRTLTLCIFNVVNIKTKERFTPGEMITFCNDNNLRYVDIIEQGEAFPKDVTIDYLLTKAKGKYKGTKNFREGIVIRSCDHSVSFKVINNDYLLKR